MIIVFLLILPMLALVSALFLYRHNGKREFLRFDVVQFIYAFMIAPALFLWLKTFSFYLLRNELDLHLTVTQLFIIDSIFTLIFLYIFAFVAIHSLTKSFKMKKLKDPLYDIFHHSEYFHLWLSHLIIFGGGLALITVFSLVNSVTPFTIELSRVQFYVLLASGVAAGVGSYIMVMLSDPLQGNFMRIMKLLFGASFLSFVVTYFAVEPSFSPTHVIYWMSFGMMTSLIVCSLFFHRSPKLLRSVEKLKDHKWGFNIEVLKR